MNPRIFIAVALLLLASPLASAGVIVFEGDAPTAVQSTFSMAGDELVDAPAIQDSDGLDASMAVSTPTTVVVLAAIAADRVIVPTANEMPERLSVANATLPPTPLLDHLLKPS
ncbi:hypothetical protein K227x_46770 [Rubripirellula lacrimiformis]|uniref:Uncharacterized protein n=1 Tax=Rubripirellula lacrimiformis TaxID=1930273 RepID=A0A517NGQ9_9BACT|nr:hypothetical protein [Rubripirellula lacrimiformis]QDT06268.1 hypothetical protein K227x_46770 [Rubripirellula lacrimiformis]